MYFLGIDGGGTRTVAVVTDKNGNIITSQSGATINFYSVGYENARKNLSELICKIKTEAHIEAFKGAFIGCSALDCEADKETTEKLCGGIINAVKVRMHSDVYIALKSVKDTECPCVAICGTGSIATGEDSDGNTYVTGGWGHILGDEGSAYSIAVKALEACCRMCDNNKKTHLLESAEKFFGVSDFRKAIDIIYSSDMTKDKLAHFAEALDMNDEAVREIIKTEAQRFAFTVQILLEKVKNCDTLGLYGGVFQHNSLFREEFSAVIRNKFPKTAIQLIKTPPAETAAEIARSL